MVPMMNRWISGFLSLLLCFSLFSFIAAAEETQPASVSVWTLSGIDTVCGASQMVAYTVAGTTGTGETCTEVLVSADGRVLSVGGYDQNVPEGGFILAGSGGKKTQLNALLPGDGIWLDRDAMTVTVVPQDYSPFYEVPLPVNGLNTTRTENTIILYDGANGKSTTETNAWGYEVTVDKNGFISGLGGNDSTIPEGGYVLSGHGTGKTLLTEAAVLGMKAILSDDRRTVTLTVDRDACLEVFRLNIAQFQLNADAASASYRLIDEQAIQTASEALSSCFAEIESALQTDNFLLYTVQGNRFALLLEQAELLLIEERPVEGRGVWIRPALNADRTVIFETARNIREAGFNQVYIELLFDNTTIMPMPEDSLFEQNPAFGGTDTLAIYIEACHSYGLEIHGWLSVFRVGVKGSSNTSRSVGSKKTEWLQISKTGKDYVSNLYGDAFFLNPALPEVQTFLLENYAYIISNYDLDGLQLDYIRYPNNEDGEDYGYDSYTCDLFEQQTGKDPRTLTSGSADYTAWCTFRASFVTEFVRKMQVLLDTLRPDMFLSAAVAPGYSTSLLSMKQDTPGWLDEQLLDLVFPMAYGTTDAVQKYTDETNALAGDNAFTYIGVSDQGADTLREQILVTREHGADGIAFFSWNVYDSKYLVISETLFASTALSPSYDGKSAMLAQLTLLKTRIESKLLPNNPELSVLPDEIDSAVEALQEESLSGCTEQLTSLLEHIKALAGSLSDAAATTAITEDCRIANKLLLLNRDDAKAEYRKTHPLPELLLTGESSAAPVSADTTEDSSSQQTVELSTVERVFQVISLLIILGGIALLPVYFVLNSRKKRIAASFKDSEHKEDSPSE